MKRPTVEAGPSVVIEKKYVVPPAVMAHRMQRYSLVLIVVSFLLVALNYTTLTSFMLWFAAGLVAAFGLMCAVTVVILHAIAWSFDRLKEELRGGRGSTDMK